jgi:hypothetical protein
MLKSIIEIDVQDDKFKAFHDLFQEYQKRVDSLPASWDKVNKSTDANTDAFAALVGETVKSVHHASEMVEQLRKATVAQKEFHVAARGAGKTLSDMAASAASIGSSIFGIGKFLSKMGALGIGALGTGLFAMDALGRGAVSGQSNARGLGLNQGQVKAFEADYGRTGLLDPSMLGTVANAKGNFTGSVWLGMASGLDYNQVQNMGADELSIKMAKRAHDWYVSTPENLRKDVVAASKGFRSETGFDWQTIQRLGNTPDSEFATAEQRYRRDSADLNVPDSQVAEWNKLTNSLKIAGEKIETVLIKDLSRLAPVIADLTSKMANAIVRLTDKATAAASATVDAIQHGAAVVGKGTWGGTRPRYSSTGKSELPSLGEMGQRALDAFKSTRPRFGGKSHDVNTQAWMNEQDRLHGNPVGTLWGLYGAESSYGMNPLSYFENGAGALGPFQFLSGTAKQYGVKDRLNTEQSAMGAEAYLDHLKRQYHGDLRRELAAYNGYAEASALEKKYGSDWYSHIPNDAKGNAFKNYVHKVEVNLKIAPGSNISVQTAQAAGR